MSERSRQIIYLCLLIVPNNKMAGDRFEYLLEMLSTLKGNWGEMETKTFDFPSQINPPHPGYISDHSTVYST